MIKVDNHLDDQLRQLCKAVIVVVFADREVNVVAVDDVHVELGDLAHILPFLLVGVSWNFFILQGFPELQQFRHVFRAFFEHNEAINVPHVEPDPTVAVLNELS